MKRIIFILSAFLIVSQSAAQTDSLKVNFDYNEVSLNDVIVDLEDRYAFAFMYEIDWLTGKLVTATVTDLNVEQAFQQIFQTIGLDFIYFEASGVVVIIKLSTLFNIDADSLLALGISDKAQVEQVMIGTPSENNKRAKLFGKVVDPNSQALLAGVSIVVQDLARGTVTDNNGSFNLELPTGEHMLIFSRVDKASQPIRLFIYADGSYDVELYDKITQLDEVVVTAEAPDENVTSVTPGVEKITIGQLKREPSALGEVDIIRNLSMLAGVSTVSEASAGFNVRGGNASENLVRLDRATIYNPSHSFGLFSAFNQDAIEAATLYKGYIPSSLGGRASSVLDLDSKEINDDYILQGGIGIISSRISFIPQLKSKRFKNVSSVRWGYGDWLFKAFFRDIGTQQFKSSFTELFNKSEYQVNENNKLTLSLYKTSDNYTLTSDTTNFFSNTAVSLNWAAALNDNLFMNTYATYSDYSTSVDGNENQVDGFSFNNGISDITLGTSLSTANDFFDDITFGFETKHITIDRGQLTGFDGNSGVAEVNVPDDKALESALFISGQFELGKFVVNSGLRYSFFNLLGPSEVFEYTLGVPKSASTVISSTQENSGVINTHHGIEPRFSLKYQVNNSLSVKASYSLNRQYLHRISTVTSITPLDIWKASDKHLQPVISNNFSLGMFKNFSNNMFETSLETYYKSSSNFLEYSGFEELALNTTLERSVVAADGEAYGVELNIKKTRGTLTGGLSYTYSRSLRRTTSPFAEKNLNNGAQFSSDFDQPHNLNFQGLYKASRRITFGVNYTYSSGRPYTRPAYFFNLFDVSVPFFEYRNQSRLPHYSRLDLSMVIGENLRINDNWKTNVTISLYNVLARRNVFTLFYRTETGGRIAPYQLSILPTMIPAITVNFRYFDD